MSEKINEIVNNSELSPEEKLKLIADLMASSETDQNPSSETDQNPSSETDQKHDDFEKIKNLLSSEEWPEAVLEFQIADENSEEDKLDRAEGIVDILIEDSLKDKKFLDFGCGEGHAVKYASEEASVSVGYDIKNKGELSWEKDEKFLLTTDFKKVLDKGPFDIVLIYDVLDHAEDPVGVLKKAESVLSSNGKIYLRCHPWSARHGGHTYRKINKAFIHLIFSEEELKSLGCDIEEHNNKVLFPIATYNEYFKITGLKIKQQDIEDQDVEDFFRFNEVIRNRILKTFQREKWDLSCPQFQMSQCFIDYVLENK